MYITRQYANDRDYHARRIDAGCGCYSATAAPHDARCGIVWGERSLSALGVTFAGDRVSS